MMTSRGVSESGEVAMRSSYQLSGMFFLGNWYSKQVYFAKVLPQGSMSCQRGHGTGARSCAQSPLRLWALQTMSKVGSAGGSIEGFQGG